MPLFESQDSRNKRLINGVWSAVGSRIGQAYPEDRPDERFQQLSHTAWLLGGGVAVAQALGLDSIKPLWGKGDETKAASLVKVFTLAMISRYSRPFNAVVMKASERQEFR